MTQGYLNAIANFTGTPQPRGCPWFALHDPFVQRVQEAHVFLESGAMQWSAPSPSNRLVDGVAFFQRAIETVRAQQLEEEKRQRELERKRQQSAPQALRIRRMR